MDKLTLLNNTPTATTDASAAGLNWRLSSPEYVAFVKKYYSAEVSFLKIGDSFVLPIAKYRHNNLLTVGTLPKTTALVPQLDPALDIDYCTIITFLREHFSDCRVIDLRVLGPGRGLKALPLCHAVATITSATTADIPGFFDKKTRNQVTQSLQHHFEIRTDAPLEDVYGLYLENMRRHGTEPKDKEYFRTLATELGSKVVFLSAYADGKLAGTQIFYINGDYVLLFHNFSDERFWPARINNFLYLKTIEYGRERGVTQFDYGPSTIGDRSHLDFKIGFGAALVPVYGYTWYRSPVDRFTALARHKARNIQMRLARLLQVRK